MLKKVESLLSGAICNKDKNEGASEKAPSFFIMFLIFYKQHV